jgi:hypothetical protein
MTAELLLEEAWLVLPDRGDGFDGCSPAERLELLGRVVGCQLIRDMTAKLPNRGIVESMHSGVLDGAPRPLCVLIGPGVTRLGTFKNLLPEGSGVAVSRRGAEPMCSGVLQ